MFRLRYPVIALCLVAAACTSAADQPAATTTPPGTTTPATSLPPESTTTTGPTTRTTRPRSEPDLPDPVDLARDGWGEIQGFVSIDPDDADLDAVDFRLRSFVGTVIEGISYAALQPEEGGAQVIGLSMSPAVFLLGDPFLAPGLAGAVSGPFDDLEDVAVDGTAAVRIFLGDRWWYFWASNTHLYATIGPELESEQALASIIAGVPTAYLWQTGDCLWFGTGADTSMPYAPYGESHLVRCSDPHTHEVIYSTTTGYGPADEHPGDGFSTEVERLCSSAFRDYIGVDWTDSKVSAIRYLPDTIEWEEGDRYTACVVELSDPEGGATRLEGTLEGIGTDSLVARSPGDCYIDALNADPVDCGVPHRAQFVGFLEDATPAGAEYPGTIELFDLQRPACEQLVDDFSPVLEKNGAAIRPHLVPPSVVAWDDGVRVFRCFALVTDLEGRQIEVSGSFEGDWEVIRFSDDDLTALRPKRIRLT
jgi:hypothetical protein